MVEKTSVCKKVYVNADGEETRSATPDVIALEFRFANGSVHAVEMVDHSGDIVSCLGWFGISEKYGNA